MDVLTQIPYGRENAITRFALCARTGKSDRAVREAIEQIRRDGDVVVHLTGTKGYWRTVDIEELRQYIHQEENRLKSIGAALRGARLLLRTLEVAQAYQAGIFDHQFKFSLMDKDGVVNGAVFGEE